MTIEGFKKNIQTNLDLLAFIDILVLTSLVSQFEFYPNYHLIDLLNLITFNDHFINKDNNFCYCENNFIISSKYNCLSMLKLSSMDDPPEYIKKIILLKDNQIASFSNQSTLRVWNISLGKCSMVLQGHDGTIWNIIQLKDEQLASCSSDLTIRLWNTTLGVCNAILKGHLKSIIDIIELDNVNSQLASCSMDQVIKLWNTINYNCIGTLCGHASMVKTMIYLHNNLLVSGGGDKTIKIWDVNTKQCTMTLNNHSKTIDEVKIMTKGRFASFSKDETIRIWNAKTYEVVGMFKNNYCNIICQLKNDLLGVVHKFTVIKIYKDDFKEKNKECTCLMSLGGHQKRIFQILELNDLTIASCSMDHTIRIWNLLEKNCVIILNDHSDVVRTLITFIDENGHHLMISCSEDETIKLWKL